MDGPTFVRLLWWVHESIEILRYAPRYMEITLLGTYLEIILRECRFHWDISPCYWESGHALGCGVEQTWSHRYQHIVNSARALLKVWIVVGSYIYSLGSELVPIKGVDHDGFWWNILNKFTEYGRASLIQWEEAYQRCLLSAMLLLWPLDDPDEMNESNELSGTSNRALVPGFFQAISVEVRYFAPPGRVLGTWRKAWPVLPCSRRCGRLYRT